MLGLMENAVIEGWLVSWQQMPLLPAIAVAFVLHLTIYLAWGSGVTVFYWALQKFQAGTLLDEQSYFSRQITSELVRSVATCGVASFVTLACIASADSAMPSSLGSMALQLLGLIVFYELVFYFLHRLLHTQPFRAVHGIHHKSVRTTPWSGFSVHPLEAIFIEVPILLFALLSPVSVVTLIAFQVLLHYVSAVGHGNYDPFGRLPGLRWLNSYMRMHQLHHARGNVNYSTFSPLMDSIFKTHAT